MTRAPLPQFDFRKLSDNGFEQYRRNRQVVRRAMRSPQCFAERCERCRVLIVAVHVAQQADQLFEGRRINAAVLLQAVFARARS